MIERIYIDRPVRNLRIIRKQNQTLEKCHHLQIVLRSCQMQNPSVSDRSQIIGQKILKLPKFNYLELELSLEKRENGCHYCTQCGEEFDLWKYLSCRSLFEKAKKYQFNVWKLKKLYGEQHHRRIMSRLLMQIIPGKQKYVCEVSRLTAVGIMEGKDGDELYDELMERFK